MGIVNKQKNVIANQEAKIRALKSMVKWRDERTIKAESALIASERMIGILIKKLGGKVTIEDMEWQKDIKPVYTEYHDISGTTDFFIKE